MPPVSRTHSNASVSISYAFHYREATRAVFEIVKHQQGY